jgi:hypothetical protein
MVECLGYMPPTRMHCTARGGGRWELARGSALSSRRALAGDDGEQRARAGLARSSLRAASHPLVAPGRGRLLPTTTSATFEIGASDDRTPGGVRRPLAQFRLLDRPRALPADRQWHPAGLLMALPGILRTRRTP